MLANNHNAAGSSSHTRLSDNNFHLHLSCIMKILCYSEKGLRLSLHGLFLVLITMLGKAWGPFQFISKIAPHSIQEDGFFTLVNLYLLDNEDGLAYK